VGRHGAGSPAFADGELHVLNWQGYGTDEAGPQDVRGSDPSESRPRLLQLRAGDADEAAHQPGTYDVVLINNTFTEQAQKEGLIQPIDPSKISHFADLTPALRDSPRFNIGGKLTASPGSGRDLLRLQHRDHQGPPDSIEVLWDPKYAGTSAARRSASPCRWRRSPPART